MARLIEAIGAQGHGVALIGGRKVYIPFTLPGETISLRSRARKARRLPLIALHRTASCPSASILGFAAAARSSTGAKPPMRNGKLILSKQPWRGKGWPRRSSRSDSYPVASRRRATLTASKENRQVRLGFNAARSHDLVDLVECPILLPQIASALPHVKAALADALPNRAEAKVHLTAAENGT